MVASSRDAADFNRFKRLTSKSSRELVSGKAMTDLEPDLSDRFSRALFFKKEAHIDPRIALSDLTNQLNQAGVEISTAEPIKTYPIALIAGDSPLKIDCPIYEALREKC